MKEKYGEGGYSKVYLKDEEYENSLTKLQDALSNKDEFIERIINVTKVLIKKLRRSIYENSCNYRECQRSWL